MREPEPLLPATPGVALLLMPISFVCMVGGVLAQSALVSLGSGVPFAAAHAQVGSDLLHLGLAQAFGLTIPCALVMWRRGHRPWQRARVVSAQRLALAFGAGLFLQLPIAALAQWIGVLFPALQPSPEDDARMRALLEPETTSALLAALFALVVVAPLTEELLFRHVLQRALVARLPKPMALTTVSVLFAIFHFDPRALVPIWLAGLALGGLAEAYDSIRVSIALHAGVNLLPLLLSSRVVPILGFNAGTPTDLVPLHVWAPSLLAAMACLGWLFRSAPAPRAAAGTH